jgi:hypothetical protein
MLRSVIEVVILVVIVVGSCCHYSVTFVQSPSIVCAVEFVMITMDDGTFVFEQVDDVVAVAADGVVVVVVVVVAAAGVVAAAVDDDDVVVVVVVAERIEIHDASQV